MDYSNVSGPYLDFFDVFENLSLFLGPLGCHTLKFQCPTFYIGYQ